MSARDQIRSDLNTADAIVRACWDNFVATEPTYIVRDMIVTELEKAREVEREACAKIADDAAPTSATGPHAEGQRMSCGQIAAAIRARSK